MSKVDVLIVGAGIAGASLAAELAPHRSVLLIEAEDLPGYHSTGRSAAFWHEGYGGPQVAPLTRASRQALQDAGLLTHRGAIHIGRDGEPIELVEGVAVEPLDRASLDERLPGLLPEWRHGVWEGGLFDIDVAALHASQIGAVRRSGGTVQLRASVQSARGSGSGWSVTLTDGTEVTAGLLVDAAGAWGDEVAGRAGVAPIGLQPKRRTMVQLRVGQNGLRRLPLIVGADGSFYFKGEADQSIWLSPHDEIDCDPCDAAPEELDIAIAIDRFQHVVNWPVERVERSWAGLRTFTPDRLPAIGFDANCPTFFWCVGQGGFGIQTAPAAAQLGAALILDSDKVPAGVDPAIYDPKRFA